MEMKKSFLFYLNWEQQVDLMTNVEAKRFIKNLCRYSKGEEVEIPSDKEMMCWLGIVRALDSNEEKWEKRVEANKKNGKLGGAPAGNQNAKKETTQNNPNNLIRDNSKEKSDKSKKVSDKSELENDNWQEKNVKSEMLIENRKEETGEDKKRINWIQVYWCKRNLHCRTSRKISS